MIIIIIIIVCLYHNITKKFDQIKQCEIDPLIGNQTSQTKPLKTEKFKIWIYILTHSQLKSLQDEDLVSIVTGSLAAVVDDFWGNGVRFDAGVFICRAFIFADWEDQRKKKKKELVKM